MIGLAGILSDTLSNKIEWVWMKLSHILSLIVPSVLLTILFTLYYSLSHYFRSSLPKIRLCFQTGTAPFLLTLIKNLIKSFETIW